MIITPFGPYSFVSQGIAIGGVLAYGEPLEQFGRLLNVAWELAPTESNELSDSVIGKNVVEHCKLDDNYDVEAQVPEILRAVELVRRARSQNKLVLVTCAAGRNRSALVVAEYLIRSLPANTTAAARLVSLDAERVIDQIQARRANSLTNPAFVKWLKRNRRT
jgi:protein-tyrosine phosphatase